MQLLLTHFKMSSKITELVRDGARAAGSAQLGICFLNYDTDSLFATTSQRHRHALGGEFYSLGVGKVSLTMTQTLEAIKEKT